MADWPEEIIKKEQNAHENNSKNNITFATVSGRFSPDFFIPNQYFLQAGTKASQQQQRF